MKKQPIQVVFLPGTNLNACLYPIDGEKLGRSVRKFKYSVARYVREHNLPQPQDMPSEGDNYEKTLRDIFKYDLNEVYDYFLKNWLEEVTAD